jgi:hypothetical protein
VKAIENELARVRVLAELPILEELNRQIMRVNLRFDVGPERRERVKRLGARPLAFRVLNRSVADILGRVFLIFSQVIYLMIHVDV